MRGTYYQTIWRNGKTGETKFYFAPTEPCDFAMDGLIVCIGQIGLYAYKMPLQLIGNYQEGIFYVETAEIPIESKEDSKTLLKYLSPELTPTQLNVVAKENLFTFCEQNDAIDTLAKAGIDKRAAKRLLNKLLALKGQKEMIRCLLKYGIPVDRIESLIKKGITLAQLKKNPYLTFLFHDIGIYCADSFAIDYCKISAYSLQRFNGFVYDALILSRSSGNTCIRLESMLQLINVRMKKSVYPDIEMTLAILNCCLSNLYEHIVQEIIGDEIYIYERHIWMEENSLIRNICRLQTDKQKVISNINVDEIEKELGIRYTEGQRRAFQLLNRSGVKILTGPPGSGKTAVIQGMIAAYEKEFGRSKVIRLSATTGRASQVMSNACHKKAETVNKMLDIRAFEGGLSKKDLSHPLQADFVIVDEVSMLGIQLASYLFQAIRSGAILLLVGDKDQLQSVEYGNVLEDLISIPQMEVYHLTESIRQKGTIAENAKKINRGYENLQQDDSFQIFNYASYEAAKKQILSDTKKGELVLSTIKRGEIGTYQLNRALQDKSSTVCMAYGNTQYRIGNPVIMLKTNYDHGYFNGDVGTVISGDGETMVVQFADKKLAMDRQDIGNMTLAYCITVHKSQGSESDIVRVILTDEAAGMNTRKILYTAITRAKKKVVIYNVNHSMEQAIGNIHDRARISILVQRYKMYKS